MKSCSSAANSTPVGPPPITTKCSRWGAFLGIVAGMAGTFELFDDALPNGARVRQVAQKQAVLVHPRYAEGVVVGAHRDQQVVVLELEAMPVAHRLALDSPRHGIDGLARRLVVGEIRHRSNRFDDAAELHRTHRCAGQQRCEEEVVARADHRDVEVPTIQPPDHLHGPETGPQNDDPCLARDAQRAWVST